MEMWRKEPEMGKIYRAWMDVKAVFVEIADMTSFKF
jgi:hypothetical protein